MLRRLFLGLAMAVTVGSASGSDLTLERIFGSPALTGPTPLAVKVSPDGRSVGMLRGRDSDQHQLDFWSYDLRDRSLRLRADSKRLVADEQLSDEEKARRERERTADFHGIVDYDWSPDGRRVLFVLGGDLYLCDLDAPPGAAPRQLTSGGKAAIDPKISPKGHYVSFLRDQDLWLIDLASGQERRLTTDGGGTIHNGEAEFVAQEEMDQSSGYWWAPDESAIAYKQFDEAPVPVAKRFEVYPDRVEIVEQRYPAAGEPNVVTRLGILALAGGATRWVDLGADADIYLPRVDWTPDSGHVAYQRLSRDQKRLDLVLVDSRTLASRTLLTETSATWVALHDDLRFLKKQPGFVWSSERSGFRHLYLYGMDGVLRQTLTSGAWPVGHLLAIDEARGLVYFSSNKDAAIDNQVYTVPLNGSAAAAPARVSRGDGWHIAQFPDDAKTVGLYVDTYSDGTSPVSVAINGPDGRHLAWIEENALNATHPYAPYVASHRPTEYGTLKAEDGQTLHYGLIKPPGFDPAKRYPVFLSVYGGPGVQSVIRRFPSSPDELYKQYMAQQGYVVFELDNRGSSRRGRAFSDAIYHQLGDAEVRDQLAGVRWLQSQPWIDPRRIGVFGWSYGGYMTLMLLAKGADQLAGGFAVAPVTDWRLYDSAYTERYLGTPKENPDGYAMSGVLPYVKDIRAPLFLAHGMADDNVLFLNSTQLMSELQSRGTQFELMTYPGAKHGLSTPQMRLHLFHALQQFFDRVVKGRPPAEAAAAH